MLEIQTIRSNQDWKSIDLPLVLAMFWTLDRHWISVERVNDDDVKGRLAVTCSL